MPNKKEGKEEKNTLLKEIKEDLFFPKKQELHPILDHYNAEINRKLGKKLFKL